MPIWEKILTQRSNLVAWHTLDNAEDGAMIPDVSGNERHYLCPVNPPELQPKVINNKPALYFDGTKNPINFTEEITVKHAFIVVKLDGLFTNGAGLLSDVESHSLLNGAGNDSNHFFNHELENAIYKLDDIEYPATYQLAPIDRFGIIELQFPDGIPLDGLQIGRDMLDNARKIKGWFVEDLFYSVIKTDCQRAEIFQYIAMKFQLWQNTYQNYYVYPFPANKTYASDLDIEHYLSESYSGDKKVLQRGDFQKNLQCPFLVRPQAEFEAAEAFIQQHYPRKRKFILRDTVRFNPARDFVCDFTSGLKEQGSDISFRFNYSFDAVSYGTLPKIPDNAVTDEGIVVTDDGEIVTD